MKTKFYPLSNVKLFPQQQIKQNAVVNLFEKTSKLGALQKEFSKILLYPKKRREQWILENQSFLQKILYQMRQESSFTLSEAFTTKQAQRQVGEYMLTVEQTLTTLERIVDESESLTD